MVRNCQPNYTMPQQILQSKLLLIFKLESSHNIQGHVPSSRHIQIQHYVLPLYIHFKSPKIRSNVGNGCSVPYVQLDKLPHFMQNEGRVAAPCNLTYTLLKIESIKCQWVCAERPCELQFQLSSFQIYSNLSSEQQSTNQ